MTSILIVIVVLVALASLFGVALTLTRMRLHPDETTLTEQVNAALPQTQCAQCGFPGCRPYAEALVAGTAATNLCPPGGESTQRALRQLLGREDAEVKPISPWLIAEIDEDICIGCALCIPACPVDAIVGANKYTHTVVSNECTGCELCVPACPVDCISIHSGKPRSATFTGSNAAEPAG